MGLWIGIRLARVTSCPAAGDRTLVHPGLGECLTGQSGVRGSPELRSRWNSQGKEAMAQVCLQEKHFLFGQCWVDGLSPHPTASPRRSICVSPMVPVCGFRSLHVCMCSVLFSPDGSPSLCQVPSPQRSLLLWDLAEGGSSVWSSTGPYLPPPPVSSSPESYTWAQIADSQVAEAWAETEQANYLAPSDLWSAGGTGGTAGVDIAAGS